MRTRERWPRSSSIRTCFSSSSSARPAPNLISAHKRLKRFREIDYDRVRSVLDRFDHHLLLPHVLTEVSNLSRQIDGPARREISLALRRVIASTDERYVPSRSATQRPEFLFLGLTDAVLIDLLALESAGWTRPS